MYSFSTILLSAQKTGSPNLIGTTLSASGVNIQILNASQIGLAFNSLTTSGTTATTVTVDLSGCRYVIDRVYHGSVMAAVFPTSYTTFTFNSAFAVLPLSSVIGEDLNISTPNQRRLRLLGYK